MEKVTGLASLTRVRVVFDHTMLTPLQRSTKLKISHLYFDQCLYPIKTSFSVKIILSKRFSTYFFTHIGPFNEMFIVNSKSHCCNDTFTDVPVCIATNRECVRRIQNIFMLLESAFHQLFCVKFSFKLITFSKSYARKQKWVFFLNTVYIGNDNRQA